MSNHAKSINSSRSYRTQIIPSAEVCGHLGVKLPGTIPRETRAEQTGKGITAVPVDIKTEVAVVCFDLQLGPATQACHVPHYGGPEAQRCLQLRSACPICMSWHSVSFLGPGGGASERSSSNSKVPVPPEFPGQPTTRCTLVDHPPILALIRPNVYRSKLVVARFSVCLLDVVLECPAPVLLPPPQAWLPNRHGIMKEGRPRGGAIRILTSSSPKVAMLLSDISSPLMIDCSDVDDGHRCRPQSSPRVWRQSMGFEFAPFK
ncbi:hypothetical protein OF83DRAFT_323258 [Amylostereum chailletii]|nr:hypothetical protein OF83DRAFT_323258 [Amylostereum chailletii]